MARRCRGLPVSDLDAYIDRYTRFFGRPRGNSRRGRGAVAIDGRAWPFIEPNVAQAGAGRVNLAGAGLDVLLARLDAERVEHEPSEIHPKAFTGHLNVPDPDGNVIAFAEPPDAASASLRQRISTLRRLRSNGSCWRTRSPDATVADAPTGSGKAVVFGLHRNEDSAAGLRRDATRS